MSLKSYVNGHLVFWRKMIGGNDGWYYEDFKKVDHKNLRPCPRCGKLPKNGHDACIKNLPGVKNACCGHGIEGQGYIQFNDGRIIRGNFEIEK